MSLKSLQAICGKKLIWAGFDKEDGLYTLVFEGPVFFRLPEFVGPIENNASFVAQFLGERLEDAKNLVALDQLIQPQGEDHVQAPEETAPVTPVVEQPAPVAVAEAVSPEPGISSDPGAASGSS